jgi:hypothetical protein
MRRIHPPAALHIEVATRQQRSLIEFVFELARAQRPIVQTINDEILEPHETDAQKGGKYSGEVISE